jgi:hypothetical protein
MMSNCQPSFRAITSAFGTFGDLDKAEAEPHGGELVADLLHPDRSAGSTRRRLRGLDGQDHVVLVQHLVVLEVVQTAPSARKMDRW